MLGICLEMKEERCTFAGTKEKKMDKEEGKGKRRWGDFETKHSMKRRSPWHDYHRKGTYMLTLVVEGRKPLLGRLSGTNAENAYVELTRLGKAIVEKEIKKIKQYYPMVDVWKLCIMPDHIHMILRVNEDMAQGKTIGNVVRGFKTGCSRAWWRIEDEGNNLGKSQGNGGWTSSRLVESKGDRVSGSTTVASAFPEVMRPVLFEHGYNDKILLHEGQLDNWKRYLDDNPRRLMMKRQNPQLFTVLHDMTIADHKCQMVGNRFLLDIPDKMAVIVHRRYTEEENARLRTEWLACGERGGVLVSAAISRKEKEVLREAMNRGYRIILLRENGFPEMYKPSGESFEACSRGLLLQISPWEYHMERKVVSRGQCLEMNEMAEKICCIHEKNV